MSKNAKTLADQIRGVAGSEPVDPALLLSGAVSARGAARDFILDITAAHTEGC